MNEQFAPGDLYSYSYRDQGDTWLVIAIYTVQDRYRLVELRCMADGTHKMCEYTVSTHPMHDPDVRIYVLRVQDILKRGRTK